MGQLTGTNFDTDVRAILGAVSTDLLPTATLLRHTNAAYIVDHCSVLDLDELDTVTTEPTVASTAYTTFDGTSHDILIPKTITDDQGTPLKEIKAHEYDLLMARAGTTTGTPTHWYRTYNATGGDLKVFWYPVPDAVVTMTLNYRRRPSALTSGTATIIDALFDESIVYLTASRSAAYLRMYDDAKKLRDYGVALRDSVAAPQIRASEYRWSMRGPSVTDGMR